MRSGPEGTPTRGSKPLLQRTSLANPNPPVLIALLCAPEERLGGSLSLLYLAGALHRAGYDVEVLDVWVRGLADSFADLFLTSTPLRQWLAALWGWHSKVSPFMCWRLPPGICCL